MNASFKYSLLTVAVKSAATAAYAENKDDTIVRRLTSCQLSFSYFCR